MLNIIKSYKWVIATSLLSIIFGLLTFFIFTNQSFATLRETNLQALLIFDLVLLTLFFSLIIYETYKIFKERRREKLGSEISLKYILLFSTTTLIPSILIAVFSLVLFNVGLQKYFDNKIKKVVNNSSEIAKNYVEESRNSIETDILLMVLDINNQSALYYENPKQFLNILISQRLLRRLDEVYLIDSSSNIIMSNLIDQDSNFITPPEEAFIKSLNNKPVRITDSLTNRTSALVKLTSFIDTYLYIVKFMDPKIINYLKQTGDAVDFYYNIQESKTGIKISFAIIYLLVVSLLLFLSIIISINFASRLTKPIISLIQASEKISLGDLESKVPQDNANKEFNKLNENFNSMIDKLKQQQDKLLMSERHLAWESVARKLAHEIKNPLTPIQLSIDSIREKYLNLAGDDIKNFSNYLNTILKQIKDIEFLLDEFSDFARMPKPKFKKINLDEVISRSLKLYQLTEKNIEFTFKKNNLHKINGDEEQLNRVFINLIKNSIESINEKQIKNADFKGKIEVVIKGLNDYIYVNITDNGVGLNQVDKTKMLTPYFTTKKKGTGLGLAIVTKIINDHNSSISFNSIKDGVKVEITFSKNYD